MEDADDMNSQVRGQYASVQRSDGTTQQNRLCYLLSWHTSFHRGKTCKKPRQNVQSDRELGIRTQIPSSCVGQNNTKLVIEKANSE